MNNKSNLLLIPMIASILFLASCGSSSSSTEAEPTLPPVTAISQVIAEGRLEPLRYADLSLEASGLVSEVLIPEGSEVSAGDLIARLESSQVQNLADARAIAAQELTDAYQSLRDTQSDLDDFDIPSELASMTPADAAQVTLEKLNQTRDAFEPYKNLSEKRLELSDAEKKQDTFETYRDTAKLYKNRLDDAWSDYRRALQWLQLDSDLKAAQARLDKAQRDYDGLQDATFAEATAGLRASLANAELRAPFAGVITKMDLKVGEFASAGTPAVTLADFSSWVVKTTDLTELDVVSIQEGEAATVQLDALPDVSLPAEVLSIGQGYTEKQGDIVYEVTLLLGKLLPEMRWGMTAEVTFED